MKQNTARAPEIGKPPKKDRDQKPKKLVNEKFGFSHKKVR